MGAITESDDNALENYFIGLALAKSSIVESIDSAIASIGWVDIETRRKWLNDDERTFLENCVAGSRWSELGLPTGEYLKKHYSDRLSDARGMQERQNGIVPTLIMRIIENLIDVHDAEAVVFIMHDKKEDVENLLLSHLLAALAKFRHVLDTQIEMCRTFFERTAEEDHHSELDDIAEKLWNEMEMLVEEYSVDAEIKGIIETFRNERARLRGL